MKDQADKLDYPNLALFELLHRVERIAKTIKDEPDAVVRAAYGGRYMEVERICVLVTELDKLAREGRLPCAWTK